MGAILRLLSRLSTISAASQSDAVRRRVSERVPVNVRNGEDDTDEPAARGGSATVRNIRWERGVEHDARRPRPELVVRGAGETHPGMRRTSNEDALLILGERAVYVVADGMGGHDGGEIASRLALDAIEASFSDGVALADLRDVPVEASALVQSLAAANEAIHRVASKDSRLSGMGTTIAAAQFRPDDGRLYVGHVGDSRCYRLRDGALEQITRDHTMAELGMTGRDAAHLSRAVGPRPVVEVDVAVLQPRAGDVYLLCTDGLTKMLSNEVIREVLEGEGGVNAAAAELVARANVAGGRDNVTALVVRVSGPETTKD